MEGLVGLQRGEEEKGRRTDVVRAAVVQVGRGEGDRNGVIGRRSIMRQC